MSEILEEVQVELLEELDERLVFGGKAAGVAEDDLRLHVVGRPVDLVRDRQLLDVVLQLLRDRHLRVRLQRSFLLFLLVALFDVECYKIIKWLIFHIYLINYTSNNYQNYIFNNKL